MEIKHLDLCETGCPMTLLLAKRAAITLKTDQQLVLDVSSVGSAKDIFCYLNAQGFKVITQELGTMTRFIVSL